MRLYIAAPWTHKPDAAAAATRAIARGHSITKPWWLHRETRDEEELMQQAVEDINGVQDADAFILLNLEKSEGKAVETGLALAAGIRIIVVGAPSNLFHHLPHVQFAPDMDCALDLLMAA
jgi:nucleoside 2-deoxyribosyltransferase